MNQSVREIIIEQLSSAQLESLIPSMMPSVQDRLLFLKHLTRKYPDVAVVINPDFELQMHRAEIGTSIKELISHNRQELTELALERIDQISENDQTILSQLIKNF